MRGHFKFEYEVLTQMTLNWIVQSQTKVCVCQQKREQSNSQNLFLELCHLIF